MHKSHNNSLIVTKPGEIVIEYYDTRGDDLKLEYVRIIKRYEINNLDSTSPGLEEAQKQFDAYMQQIKEIKIKQGNFK